MSVTTFCAVPKTDKCNIYISKRAFSVFIFYFFFFLFFQFYFVCPSFSVIIHESKKKKTTMRRKTPILQLFENCMTTKKDGNFYSSKRYITNYYNVPLKIQKKNQVPNVMKFFFLYGPNGKYNYVTNIIKEKNRTPFSFFLYNKYFLANAQIKKCNYHQEINKMNIKKDGNKKIYIHTKRDINQSDTNQSDTNQSDINQSDTNQSDTNQSDTNQSDTNQSDINHSDTNQSDTNQSYTNQPNEKKFENFNGVKNPNDRDTKKILYLINPRGFCKGVSRAIETVEECLKLFKPPIYVKHKIVHNDIVCKRLEEEGAIFIEDLNDVPDESILIYSAHGISPQIREIAKKKKLIEIDATCPLVNKVHVYVKMKSKENYDIILIGYKNHVEVIGTYNEAPQCTHIVENINDVEKLNFQTNKKLFYVTQTTLSMDDCALIVQKLKNKYPHIETIPSGSICYATTNRQTALNQICTKCDLTIVVGSSSSSNAKKLVYSSQIRNVPAVLLNTVNDLDHQILHNVNKIALTSAASTPEEETQKFVNLLTNPPFNYTLQYFDGVQENVPKWKLPKNLMDMIKEREQRKK
ncbi:4-hydroxy-3-methylbut-2-enyl diphosphate reductase [Plasmodium gaboni]|uniref:4-hydroxy-3-methylbut-2-enyl diphosphate reductase n=1 Tax=Plasmodium gaboni TaxID=647221 RepID=A0ABY1UGE0_9APIC|nr:4-hydroxy-3-methylbut-2-enyl diphosphate reductase [Plasmodium gaboni]